MDAVGFHRQDPERSPQGSTARSPSYRFGHPISVHWLQGDTRKHHLREFLPAIYRELRRNPLWFLETDWPTREQATGYDRRTESDRGNPLGADGVLVVVIGNPSGPILNLREFCRYSAGCSEGI